jgi:hypothetical protein
MRTTGKPWLALSAALLMLPLIMGGACATPTPPDVGRVVVAPKVQIPPVPAIVQQTLPEPAGSFQCSFLTYFGLGCDAPTK